MQAGLLEVLLGRVADATVVGNTSREQDLVESIINNLHHLFNTRQGTIAHLPDYGLPDLSELYRDTPDSVVPEMQQAIEAVVEKYEPRLQRVRVTYKRTEPYRVRLVFVLSAELVDREKVQFEATLSTREMVNIRTSQQS